MSCHSETNDGAIKGCGCAQESNTPQMQGFVERNFERLYLMVAKKKVLMTLLNLNRTTELLNVTVNSPWCTTFSLKKIKEKIDRRLFERNRSNPIRITCFF